MKIFIFAELKFPAFSRLLYGPLLSISNEFRLALLSLRGSYL